MQAMKTLELKDFLTEPLSIYISMAVTPLMWFTKNKAYMQHT